MKIVIKFIHFCIITILIVITNCTFEENLTSHSDNGRLVINECMVRNSNESGIHDADGNFNDWIELYNISNDTIYLGDYFISDQSSNLFKYQLPQSYLLPNEHFLVWGGTSETSPETHLGFNFSADSTKNEMILLSNFLGEIIDSLNYLGNEVALKKNRSFGRKPDGATTWYSLEIATPGSSNIW